ncbi:MAG: LCP family protein [Actinomycetota bacterium]|nr:LCP family protein [Actinomycetota bacterium]
MPSNGEQQPPDKDDQQPSGRPGQGSSKPPERPSPKPSGPPEYTVYRSRKGILSRLRSPDVSNLRQRARRSYRRLGRGGPKAEDQPPTAPKPLARRALKWVGIAVGVWVLISFLAFAVSAQLQEWKLAGGAKSVLHGNPFLLVSPQTILMIGTDARPPDTKEPGAAPSQPCFDQQSHGDAPHGGCSQGQFRADTLMLIRAGGGHFRKLSIPRDSFAEIPGHESQKINAAYAFGGAKLQIQTVERFLGIKIDHVVIIDFTGFQDFIDAIGGVKVDVPQKLCADISGGAGGGQGGITLHLGNGEHTLNGQQALAYARIREPSPCPGPGHSAFGSGYNDLDRAKAQQAVIAGIKGRLTSPFRLPYNFIHGPIIGWDAPKAFVSDMGFFTMPQLILSSTIGGSSTNVLCARVATSCSPGPLGSTEVPESERQRAVKQLEG